MVEGVGEEGGAGISMDRLMVEYEAPEDRYQQEYAEVGVAMALEPDRWVGNSDGL